MVRRNNIRTRPDEAAVRQCRQVLRQLGFEFGKRRIRDLRAISLSRLSQPRQEYGDSIAVHRGLPWQELLIRRDLLKVLSGHRLKEEVRAAIHKTTNARREQLFNGLSNNENNRRWLDPLSWKGNGGQGLSRQDRVMRLSLLVSAMLLQEKELGDLELSPTLCAQALYPSRTRG